MDCTSTPETVACVSLLVCPATEQICLGFAVTTGDSAAFHSHSGTRRSEARQSIFIARSVGPPVPRR